ncbi:MAG: hypothetical protein E7208_01470 [Clostridium butyricum]|jgi:hypothetical protein|nr:hypothetical protein [Clostridium butyricum]
MKLKRSLALFMTASLGVATLTGCSEATTNYAKELGNTTKWAASSTETNGNVTIEAEGEKMNISFTGSGYTSGNKGFAEVKFNDPSGLIKIPDIKVYSDNGISYINKSYFEGIYTMSGLKVPEKLAKINAEYISIDSGIDVGKLQAIATNPEAMLELGKTFFGDVDIDLPYVQNGREFTMNLNSDEMVDLSVKAVKASVNNLESINSDFRLGLASEDIAQVKAMMNDQNINEGIKEIKTMLTGSKLSLKEVFSDDTYTEDIKMVLQLKDIGKVDVQVTGKSTKTDSKEINIPTSVVKLTQDEYLDMMGGTDVTAETNSAASNVIFVPAA